MKAVALPAIRLLAVRAVLAALPLVSLGLLCPVPSLILAVRRRRGADWWAFGAFSLVLAAWITWVQLTPDHTHGLSFVVDLTLIALSMGGASLHAWTAWPGRSGAR